MLHEKFVPNSPPAFIALSSPFGRPRTVTKETISDFSTSAVSVLALHHFLSRQELAPDLLLRDTAGCAQEPPRNRDVVIGNHGFGRKLSF
jgi:hypothetical protein